jgi:hypothetical protein
MIRETVSRHRVVLAVALGLMAVPGVGILADEDPAEITSDTPAYCTALAQRLAVMVDESHQAPETEVVHLWSEGQRLCEHGQVRMGITRLRKAVWLLNHHDRD